MTKVRTFSLALTAILVLPIVAIDQVEAGFAEGVKAYEAKEYKLAFDEWLPLARTNDPAAMRNIGHMYRRGFGVPQDYKKALTWYKRAATIGFDRAQANVAGMYLKGEGVSQDYKLAAKWFYLAAKQGHVVSQYNLALLLENGLGVKQDETKALGWFNLAAKAGHPQAIDKASRLVARGVEEPDTSEITNSEKNDNPPETVSAAPVLTKPVVSQPAATAPPLKVAEQPVAEQLSSPVSKVEKALPTSDPNSNRSSEATVVSDAAREEGESTEKKGFYEALKSLVVTQAPVSSEPKEMQGAEPEEVLRVSEPEKDTVKVVTASVQPRPVIAPPSPVTRTAPAPVKVAAVAPKPQTSKINASPKAGTGLTIDEQLEMADLAFTLQQYQDSLGIWAVLAQQDNAEAQFKLGGLFNAGLAVPVDRVRAYHWWEKAKKNGWAEAAPALAGLEKSLTHVEKRQIQRTN